MSAISAAAACVQRVDHGEGKPLTLAEAVAQVEHPLTGLKRDELVEAVAYLACQVVGLRQSRDANAPLALQQIARVVADYARRQPYTLTAAETEQVGQLTLDGSSERCVGCRGEPEHPDQQGWCDNCRRESHDAELFDLRGNR